MPLTFSGAYPLPGIGGTLTTTENIVWWGLREQQKVMSAVLDDTARDISSSPTDVLPAGLALGKITASGKLAQWNPEATDGTEHIYGILLYDQRMIDSTTGSGSDRWFGYVLVGGNIKASSLIIPLTISAGAVLTSGSLTALTTDSTYGMLARAQLASTGRFMLDDEPNGSMWGGWKNTRVVNGSTESPFTVTEAHNDTIFINMGAACTFALPSARPGLHFGFLSGSAHAITIAPASGTMITPGVAADASLTVAATIGIFNEVIGIVKDYANTSGNGQYITLPSSGTITSYAGGSAEAVTAISGGATTGLITSGTTVALITGITANPTHAVTLPNSIFVGQKIQLRNITAFPCMIYTLAAGNQIDSIAGTTGIPLGPYESIEVQSSDITGGAQRWATVNKRVASLESVTATSDGATTGLILSGTDIALVTGVTLHTEYAVTLPNALRIGERISLRNGTAFPCMIFTLAAGNQIEGIAGTTGIMLGPNEAMEVVCGVVTTGGQRWYVANKAPIGVVITKIVPFVENATNDVHTGTVPIPAGAIVHSIKFVNTVLWGATTASLIVGDDDDDNGYFEATDCKATDLLVGEVLDTAEEGCWGGVEGAYLVTATGQRGAAETGNSGPYYGVANNIIAVMAVGTPAATTGRSFMSVSYSVGDIIAAVATGP